MKQFIRYLCLDILLLKLVSKSFIKVGQRRKNEKVDIQSIEVWNPTHSRSDTLIPSLKFIKGTLVKVSLQEREHTVLRSNEDQMHIQLFKDTLQQYYIIATYLRQGFIDVQVLGKVWNGKARKAYNERITQVVKDLGGDDE